MSDESGERGGLVLLGQHRHTIIFPPAVALIRVRRPFFFSSVILVRTKARKLSISVGGCSSGWVDGWVGGRVEALVSDAQGGLSVSRTRALGLSLYVTSRIICKSPSPRGRVRFATTTTTTTTTTTNPHTRSSLGETHK